MFCYVSIKVLRDLRRQHLRRFFLPIREMGVVHSLKVSARNFQVGWHLQERYSAYYKRI